MAFAFNGSTQFVTYPHRAELDGIVKFMLSYWIKRAAVSSFYDGIIAQIGAAGTGPGNTAGFGVQSDNADPTSLFCSARNGLEAFLYQDGLLSDANWWSVFHAYDGTGVGDNGRWRTWLRGTQIVSGWTGADNPIPASLGTCDQPLQLAKADPGTGLFAGALAAPAFIFGSVTSAATLAAAVWNSGAAQPFTSVATPDWYAELDDTFDPTVGSGAPTITGAPTRVAHPYALTAPRAFYFNNQRTRPAPFRPGLAR